MNYRVRFRHGVYPKTGAQASRADIKKYDYFFEIGQRWVDTTGDVNFVDESSQIGEDVEPESGTAGEGRNRQNLKPLRSLRRSARIGNTTPQILEVPKNVRGNSAPLDNHTSGQSEGQAFVSAGAAFNPVQSSKRENLAPPRGIVRSSSVPLPDPSSQFSQTSPEYQVDWPLEDPIEAQLFRFFVETVGSWWDITSSDSVWRKVVPKLALRNPILLNAIFLMAAQCIRGFDASFPAEPFQYHERVLNLLIPYLADRGGIDDEATLSAAILLRAFEEYVAGTEGQTHLSTFELFTNDGGALLNSQSIVVKACFLVHIRFEIYSSLLGRTSPQVNYKNFMLPELANPTDDVAWANRMVWITARVLQWLTSNQPDEDEWHELTALINHWELSRPDSFTPFFKREANVSEGRYYPDFWYNSPHHTDGNQHLAIARTILAVHDHKLGHVNDDTRHASLRENDVVVSGLKTVIAIARCNTNTVPALFVAGNFADGYASLLVDDLDREQIVLFLDEVSAMGWQTYETQKQLRTHWGWSVSDV